MNARVLRGHHLLCVHGFRGMGYSPAFIEKMKEIVYEIRNTHLDFSIQVILGLDETCSFCPHSGNGCCNKSRESNHHVLELDKRVTEHLGIKGGEYYQKSQLVSLVVNKIEPGDLDYLCEGCSWLNLGFCKEGIANLKNTEKLN